MRSILSGNSIFCNWAQFAKAEAGITLILSLNFMDVSPLQFQKAPLPNEVTVLGMEIERKLVHPQKVFSPIEVRPEANTIPSREEHPEKASLPMESTFSRKSIEANEEQFSNADSPITLMLFGKFTVVKAEQL